MIVKQKYFLLKKLQYNGRVVWFQCWSCSGAWRAVQWYLNQWSESYKNAGFEVRNNFHLDTKIRIVQRSNAFFQFLHLRFTWIEARNRCDLQSQNLSSCIIRQFDDQRQFSRQRTSVSPPNSEGLMTSLTWVPAEIFRGRGKICQWRHNGHDATLISHE